MAATALERMRCTQEDLERVEDEMASLLIDEPKNLREVVDRSHRVAMLLDIHAKKRKELLQLIDDKDGSKEDEATAMTGTSQAVYSAFYDRMREAKEYHRKFPSMELEPQVHYLPESVPEVPFSVEERHGRYVDLNAFHRQYNNLPFRRGKPVSYEAYLDLATQFSPSNTSSGKAYVQYLTALRDYLQHYVTRSQPLFDLLSAKKSIVSDFDEQWTAGTFTEWAGEGRKAVADPLYCKFCKKKFSKETVFESHKTGKKHKQAVEFYRRTFALEYEIHRMGQIVGDQIQQTKHYIVAKFAKSYDEIQADLAAEEEYSDDDDDEENEDDDDITSHGIENYPVGFDGKPIPFWLYKLHGLGTEFKCEICGNTSYWGRRAYERHFSEARHSYGMRCLGVPNLPHFKEITGIKDVLALWEKLKKDKKTKEWNPDNEEEFEDSEGTILVGKKTFELMARQNLV